MAHTNGSSARFAVLGMFVAQAACSGTVRPGEARAPADGGGSGGGFAGKGGDGTDRPADPPPGTPRITPATYASCAAVKVAAQPMRRLGAEQHRRTIEDLVRLALEDEAAAKTVLEEIGPALDRIPDDTRAKLPGATHGTFRRLDQTVQQVYVDATYDVALKTAAALTRPEHLPKVLGACASASKAADVTACVEAFVKSFGGRALRAPLNDRQVSLYRGIYSGAANETSKVDAAALADVIGSLLAAPEAMYLVEHGRGVGRAGSDLPLSGFELAARLSYHFWNTTPDDRLWAAAESGKLDRDDGYAEVVDAVAGDVRARVSADEFFAEYFATEDLPALDAKNDDKVFKAFAGRALPSGELRRSVVQEALALARYFTFTKAGTFDELLETDHVFTTSAELASLYGTTPWSGEGTPPSFPAKERPGFLTRAVFLMNDDVVTRPVMRGVMLRTNYLCDAIPPPPDNSMDVATAELKKLPATATTRERTEAITVKSSPACAACHANIINPLGYPFEGYDSLARRRAEETILSASGQALGTAAIDTSSVPRVADGDNARAAGAAELVELVRTSGRAHGCFAQTYLRFAYGRTEDAANDACVIGPTKDALVKGAPVFDAFRGIAYTPSFRRRGF